MALYEHVFMARQDISQAHLEGLVETFKGVLEANGGSVGRIEHWGLRTVTYRVKKNRKCYYVLMDITAPAAAVAEMERQMSISEDILRIFTIKVDAHETGPSAMLQKRDRDDDRSERGGDRFDRPRRERSDRPDRAPRRPRDEDSESAGA